MDSSEWLCYPCHSLPFKQKVHRDFRSSREKGSENLQPTNGALLPPLEGEGVLSTGVQTNRNPARAEGLAVAAERFAKAVVFDVVPVTHHGGVAAVRAQRGAA